MITSFVASYIKAVTVKMTLFTDWFTFLIAIFLSNLAYFVLINNFSELSVSYADIFYNSMFTFIFFPLFWVLFNTYSLLTGASRHD